MSRDSLTLTFHNDSESTLRTRVGTYTFYYWGEGGWAIGPAGPSATLPIRELDPGDRVDWQIHQRAERFEPVYTPQGEQITNDRWEFAFRFLPGIYAFGYRVWTRTKRTPDSTDSSETRSFDFDYHLYTTPFRVVGETPPLIPSNAVLKTARRGDTLIVRTQIDDEDARKVSLIADRLPSTSPGAARVSLVALYNPSGGFRQQGDPHPPEPDLLRDGFAHYDGNASRIRIETRQSNVPSLGINEPEEVVYDGTPWRIDAVNGWS